MYKFMPAKYKRGMSELLKFAGSKKKPKGFFNSVLILSIIIGAVLSLVIQNAFVGIGVGVGVFVLFHGFVILAVDRRAHFVESILPDALQLMAANARAGYIPSRALILSARPEFGPLSEAIKKAGKDMLTGDSVEEALRKIPRYIKSKVLEKTISLIIEGSRSGGRFATLLEENAEDIRRVQILQKEVRANVIMYVIFLGFAGAVAAPVRYALSGFLIPTRSTIGASSVPEEAFSGVVFLNFSGVNVSADFLFGSISTGSEKAGFKYVPIFMIVAFTIYFVTIGFIGSLFGTLLS